MCTCHTHNNHNFPYAAKRVIDSYVINVKKKRDKKIEAIQTYHTNLDSTAMKKKPRRKIFERQRVVDSMFMRKP